MGVSGGTGFAPIGARTSTLSSKASRSSALRADLEMRGARVGGMAFFMVDLGKLLFFNGEFKFAAGESVRRGKLIAVKLKLLTAVRRFAQ